ncbi:MAG: hypothetical protein ACYCPO_16825 [Acidobacteriaceae bacterium]
MGLVTMSERDLKRIQVLTEVLAGQRTVTSAAAVLSLGVRQTFRLTLQSCNSMVRVVHWFPL